MTAALTGLYYGAPAIAFMLHTATATATATADGRERYPAARQALDQQVRRLTRQRLAAAEERISHGRPATFAEYDLFYGLVGIGALLLHQAPGSDELGGLLRCVVRLTEPRRHDGLHVPGWWVDHDPDPILPTPGGHANAGMAHGLAGLYQTAFRAAADAENPSIARRLPRLAERLSASAHDHDRDGFLTGRPGIALALETIRTGEPPHTRWDVCLLIT